MVSGEADLAAFERRRRKYTRDYDLLMSHAARRFEKGSPSLWHRSVHVWKRQFLSHYFFGAPAWRMVLRRLDGERVPPDFAVVGAIKSGTSDLSVNLLMHPNVVPPLAKEYGVLEKQYWPSARARKRHVERFGVALVPLIHPILHALDCAYVLAQMRPRRRIVIALREPVSRLYSHWKWEVLQSHPRRVSELPFLSTFSGYANHALERFPDAPMHTQCGAYGLAQSIYWKSVRYWIEWCGAENVLVLDAGEYFRDRDGVMRRIQEFVGLPYVPLPAGAKPVNENPLHLPRPDEESVAKLREFFRPYNERLWNVIGQRFAW